MNDRSHDEAMGEIYRSDPAYAVGLLNAVLEDGDQEELIRTVRRIAAAFGVAAGTTGSASDIGNLVAVIRAMGLRLAATPEPAPQKRVAKPAAAKQAGRGRRPAAKIAKAPV